MTNEHFPYSKGSNQSGWVELTGTTDLFSVDNLSYDLNGNILSLRRYTKEITGKVEMDNLVYDYGTSSARSNQLLKVTDNGDDVKGFKDGANTGDDYSYDVNGNLTQDLNKDITSITYNYLNLPTLVTRADGKSIEYVYDAAGIKIRQIVNDTEARTTDYLGEYIYEDGEISLIQHEEGRIVRDLETGGWEYQYHIKDHLGNVRTTFTSRPKEIEFNLNYESDTTLLDDEALFEELDDIVSNELFDHTDATTTYTKSQRLTGANNSRIGSVLAVPVGKGDKISAEVYAKYEEVTSNPNTGLTALGTMLINSLTGGATMVNEFGQATINNSYTGTNGAIIGTSGFTPGNGNIYGFLNVLFISTDDSTSIDASRFAFDQISSGAQQIGTTNKEPHDLLSIQDFEAPTNGIAIIYLSNEQVNQTNIYFDDLKVTINEHPVIQSDDYYPFGLTFNSYQRVTGKENNFLFNQGTGEKTFKTERISALDLNVDMTKFRVLDPAIGRWWQVDPVSEALAEWTPYNYSFNNPILLNDPFGDCPPWLCGSIEKAKLYAVRKASEYVAKLGNNLIEQGKEQIRKLDPTFFAEAEVTVDAQAGGAAGVRGASANYNYASENVLTFGGSVEHNAEGWQAENSSRTANSDNTERGSGAGGSLIFSYNQESEETKDNKLQGGQVRNSTQSESYGMGLVVVAEYEKETEQSGNTEHKAQFNTGASIGIGLVIGFDISIGIKVTDQQE